MSDPVLEAGFRNAPVLITGGLGFIGSNLAHRLVGLGAEVHLLDALIPEHGGALSNIEEIADRVQLTVGDLRDDGAVDEALAGCRYVFNLAGQSSHWDSMVDPHGDLEINCRAQLDLLERIRRRRPDARVVLASTRQVYGRPQYLPVDEDHPLAPVDVNGIHKVASENYHRLYAATYGLRCTTLRLTNTIGPRMRIRDARQGVAGLWIRLALEGTPFEVWGGEQLRDFNYVDDVVAAFLLSALSESAAGRIYNLGSAHPVALCRFAELLREETGCGFVVKSFPEDRKAIDIGDYHANFSRIREELGWEPRTSLRCAVERTLAYCAANRARYAENASAPREVPVSDPKRGGSRRGTQIAAAIERVLESGCYIGGDEVTAFEQEFAAYIATASAVAVGSGTAALEIALRACGVGPGDRVATVSLTAVGTIAAIELAGATPVLVDIDPERFTLDPEQLERLLSSGPVRAIVPVHLYGQPADMPRIMELASRYGALVIEDCAQAHGAAIGGRKCGTWGRMAAFSFYPTKNLGAFGDGGAIVTDDAELAQRARLLREYGWRHRHISDIPGLNSRLDAIQAAVLRVKLRRLEQDNRRRQEVARRYGDLLGASGLELPVTASGSTHVFHQYVVRSSVRAALREHLARRGIQTAVHYPVPLHLQPAYRGRVPVHGAQLPHTERACAEVVSLPCFPELSGEEQAAVADAVRSFGGALKPAEAAVSPGG